MGEAVAIYLFQAGEGGIDKFKLILIRLKGSTVEQVNEDFGWGKKANGRRQGATPNRRGCHLRFTGSKSYLVALTSVPPCSDDVFL
jgi:hypothetical protein